MDDGFNHRVDKVFASISSSSSWSLTDAQLQRREWNRDQRDDDQIPLASSFHNDDWDIRSSIGLDSTLDNEDEEDAYDKMAQGREIGGDRLYMKDVTEHGLYLNAHNVLPRSLHDVKKDPRADHDAAKTRLKEDDSLQGSDEPMLNAQVGTVRIKSILRRRRSCCDEEAAKPAKRVRFDSTCKNVDAEGFGLAQASPNGPGVPDYILNPSNYTRYTFDDSSCDSEEAYLEQIKNLSKHGGVEQKSLPKSVVFIPRKKTCNSEEQVKQLPTQACSTVGIAAVEGEISEMQEDDDLCTKARSQKPVRQYRSKIEECDDDIC